MLHLKQILIFIAVFFMMDVGAYPLVPPVTGSLCYQSNSHFDGFRYDEQIAHCRRAVSSSQKDRVCRRDGVMYRTSDFQVDHIISLSMGGSNKDDNLWCQHTSLNVTRQEYSTYIRLRNGEISQVDAIIYILGLKFKLLTSK